MYIIRRIYIVIITCLYCGLFVHALSPNRDKLLDIDNLKPIDSVVINSSNNVDSLSNPHIISYDNSPLDSIVTIANISNKKWVPNSRKALLWSLLPGGGQIYNKKYWKLPIVLGAFTTCVYAIRFNQQRFNEYHDAYRDMSSSDPSKNTAWLAFTPRGTKPEDYNSYKYLLNNFQRGDEYFHRWRDISIVAAIGVYALSMIDAYVDAELATFDISPDLSMKIYPHLERSMGFNIGCNIALGCSISF